MEVESILKSFKIPLGQYGIKHKNYCVSFIKRDDNEIALLIILKYHFEYTRIEMLISNT